MSASRQFAGYEPGKAITMNMFERVNELQKKRRLGKRARGMTLIEIMVVLVILGLIASAIGYNVFNQLGAAQEKAAKLDLSALSNGVDLYHVETGQWPDSLAQLVPKFVKEVHKDPWGSDYAYVRSGEGYDIYSYGKDKAQGGGDDITVHGGDAPGGQH
jgi:general secretion pathway protein G